MIKITFLCFIKGHNVFLQSKQKRKKLLILKKVFLAGQGFTAEDKDHLIHGFTLWLSTSWVR